MKALSARSLNVLRFIFDHQDSMKLPGAIVKKSQKRIADRLVNDGYAELLQTIKGYRLFTTSKGDDLLEVSSHPTETETTPKTITQLELRY